MNTEGEARSPVQETYSKDTGPDLKELHLSIEETPLLKPKRCRRQNVDKNLETNLDVKLDNRAIDHGPDHKPSTCNGQGHMDFSCNGPNSNASEDEGKTLDDSSAKDNVSTAFQQDGNNTMSCALENDASIVPLSGTPETEHKAHKVGYRPNDEKCAVPGASKPGQNASTFKTADSNNIVEDTTITGGKLQDGGDMENRSAIDPENETLTDHGKDNNDSLCRRSSIKETDVKEEKRDGTLPMANASKVLQHDVTKDLDGHAAMTLKSQDSTTAVLKENTLTQQSNGSNDSTSNHFESGQNAHVGCRASGDVQDHHEGNIFSPLVCQTGRHSSSDCIGNQIPNILKIDVGTSTDPYDRRSKSKKRRRNKCRADNLSINRNPEDKISSGQERNKIGLNSQNQAPVIEKSPNALVTTSDTSFQQDDNVSVITKAGHRTSLSCTSENYTTSGSQTEGEGPSRASKPSSGSTVLRKASNISYLMSFCSFKLLVALIIVASAMAQAYPVQKQWQQFQFCSKDGPLNDQPLTVINEQNRSSEACTIIFSSAPFFHNCSKSRSLFFVENSTCVDALTEDLTTEHMSMEYGRNRNGKSLPAVPEGRVNERSVWERVAKYTKTADGSAQRLSAEDSTRTDASPRQKRWQQFWFHMTEGSLIGQVLTIKDMKDRRSEGCTFKIGAVPFFKNCSQLGALVFVENQTCAEMLTEDWTTEDWRMEYGSTRNGDGLPAARGGTLNEKSVIKKIAEYTEPADNSAQGWSAEDIVKTAAGIGVLILILLALFLLYIFCQKFKRWVNEVVRRRGRRDTNTIPGANLESDANGILLVPKTSTNGTTNGGLQNGESKSETLSAALLETDQMGTDTTTQAEDSALPRSL